MPLYQHILFTVILRGAFCIALVAASPADIQAQAADPDGGIPGWSEIPEFDRLTDRVVDELQRLDVKAFRAPSRADTTGSDLSVAIGPTDSTTAASALRIDPRASFEAATRHDLERLHDLLEALELVEQDAVAELVIPGPGAPSESLERAADTAGFTLRPVGLSDLNRGHAVALYVPPGSAVDGAETARHLQKTGLLGFSGRGRTDVEQGLAAGPAVDREQRLARQIALKVLARSRGLNETNKSLGSGAPESTEDSARPRERLALNLETLHALGLDLPWRLRLEADLIGAAPESDETLTVAEARREALAHNLPRRAADLRTAAGEEQVKAALAALRPRAAVRADVGWIDRDSAVASFGARPERLVTGGLELGWTLFSEPARATVDVAERLQAARRLGLQELELDIALQASLGLLELSRARAFEAIERQTLESTFAELDAALSRRRAGAGGRADVARLEARAARDRQALVTAHGAQRRQALALNQLLGRPLNQDLAVLADSENASLPLETFVARRSRLARLERELLVRARRNAPEVAAAELVKEARERELLAARRAFYLPSVDTFAALTTRLATSGDGEAPPSLPFPGVDFPETPDTSWSLGLTASLPIFTGGARQARRAEADLELKAAQVSADDAARRVEERVRGALVDLDTAYEAARQARAAVSAALIAFDTVSAAYAEGAATLTALLDAQATLRSARLGQAAARLGALARWALLQRAVGTFWEPRDITALQQSLLTSKRPDPTTETSVATENAR